MPALTTKVLELKSANYFWRSFKLNVVPDGPNKVLAPEGYGDVQGNGKLDLSKVEQFFMGSQMTMENLREIRLRTHLVGEPMSDREVNDVFDIYCNQLYAKNVTYHYNAEISPFDDVYQGLSNCMGRAKGFLQLMAMLGVPKEQLAYCMIGGSVGDEGKKLCQKAAGEILGTSVRWVAGGPAVPASAPNAVRIEPDGGGVLVSRTPREPFANHYATRLDIPGLSMKYFDPLERYVSRNGFSDVFTGYEPAPELLRAYQDLVRKGLQVLANPDNQKERLYLLPPANQRPTNAPQNAYFRQPAFTQVEQALSEMNTGGGQVIMIVDATDYESATSLAPRVFAKMFA